MCRRASRGVLAKLGNVEDIMNIFEFPHEIQPVGSLPNTLQHPEWTYKPSPKLPSPQPGEVSLKRAALLLPPDAPKVGGACQNSASSTPGLS